MERSSRLPRSFSHPDDVPFRLRAFLFCSACPSPRTTPATHPATMPPSSKRSLASPLPVKNHSTLPNSFSNPSEAGEPLRTSIPNSRLNSVLPTHPSRSPSPSRKDQPPVAPIRRAHRPTLALGKFVAPSPELVGTTRLPGRAGCEDGRMSDMRGSIRPEVVAGGHW